VKINGNFFQKIQTKVSVKRIRRLELARLPGQKQNKVSDPNFFLIGSFSKGKLV